MQFDPLALPTVIRNGHRYIRWFDKIVPDANSLRRLCRPMPLGSQIDRIIDAVCTVHGLTKNQLFVQRRTADLLRPRQQAMYFACIMTPLTVSAIGREMGSHRPRGRRVYHHTTVLHGANVAKRMLRMKQEPWLHEMRQIENLIWPRIARDGI